MSRPRISDSQRIVDMFTDMEVLEQTSLLAELEKLHKFSVKRDARILKPSNGNKRKEQSA